MKMNLSAPTELLQHNSINKKVESVLYKPFTFLKKHQVYKIISSL